MSTRWVAPCSRAYQSASASTSRPSASVLMISIVLPFIAVRMSPGRKACAARHVLSRGNDGEHAQRDAELGDRAHALDHRAAARHVPLHVLHVVGRLERDAAGVERDRLADEAEHEVVARAGRLVAQHDQPGLVVAPLRRLRRRRPCPSPRSARGRRPRTRGRPSLGAISAARSARRSGVRSLAGRFERSRARFAHCATRFAWSRAADRLVADERQPLEGLCPRAGRLPRAGVVTAEDEPVDDRTRLVGSAQRQRGVEEPGERPAEAEAGDARCGVADRVGVELVMPAAACGDYSPVVRMENAVAPAAPDTSPAASSGSSRGSASDSTGSNTAKAVVSALTRSC